MRNGSETESDAVLIEFTQAGPGTDLADWVRRHPEHARDLVRLAEGRWLDAGTPADAADAHTLSLARAVLGQMRAARGARTAAPLTSLLAAAKARGLDAEAAAARLQLPVTCFWKLHRRLFAPESVPRSLVTALAETLGRAADEVAAYLERPPALATGASYRADAAPRVGREDFAAALSADPEATEAQRARWLPADGR